MTPREVTRAFWSIIRASYTDDEYEALYQEALEMGDEA